MKLETGVAVVILSIYPSPFALEPFTGPQTDFVEHFVEALRD
jgi:hypothetical protein